ncbi:MAG: AI-2E family transporter [Xanthobacteraceae bacterium]
MSVQTPEPQSLELPPTAEERVPSAVTVLLTVLVLFAALTAAYVAAEVILPVFLAIVLKLLLEPAMRFLTRFRLPRALCAILLILAIFAVLLGFGAFVSGPAVNWAHRLPSDLPRVQEKLQFLSGPAKAVTDMLHKAETFGQGDQAKSLTLPNIDFASILFRGTRHFASGLFETILVLFFLLVSGGTFLRKLVEIMPSFKDKRQVVDLSQQIESNISAYLLTITMMNAVVGTATGLIMWLTGVGDPILWGVVAFFLNYVPIIGPFFGVILFLATGLIVMPTILWGLLPAALYLLVHVLEGETITPVLLARRFTLSSGDYFVDLLVLDVGRAWGNSVCANVGDHQDCMRWRRAFERNWALSGRRDGIVRGLGRTNDRAAARW